VSLISFPQKRETENLVYVILPLGFALWLGIKYFDLSNPLLITAMSFSASVGALFLYIFAPADIILRNVLRKQAGSNAGIKVAIVGWYKEVNSSSPDEENIKQLRKTAISNSVSSYPIRNRCVRIRAWEYFLVSYYFYASTGYILLKSANFESWWKSWILEAYIPIFGILFLFAIALFFVRRNYGAYLIRDIVYVAEFIFATWMIRKMDDEAKRKNQLEEISYFDELLLREDLDTFAIMWGNTFSKMPKVGEQEKKKERIRKKMSALWSHIFL
jgi:hypothetical protein